MDKMLGILGPFMLCLVVAVYIVWDSVGRANEELFMIFCGLSVVVAVSFATIGIIVFLAFYSIVIRLEVNDSGDIVVK